MVAFSQWAQMWKHRTKQTWIMLLEDLSWRELLTTWCSYDFNIEVLSVFSNLTYTDKGGDFPTLT